ncbi:N5-carboxyaminoimidazole ribonucleotide mutase-like [Ylistrum balloti]|uniref:N5-carboxyaminoimidazole ribonucleotide mutase-like n=1 Tax=Ylistrum balloti TaxID=509963 RepID=UPI002905BDAE|nr:N5-carboxyaminoimidazole ribonucleotide mutase-like [Ylistrum balloti]
MKILIIIGSQSDLTTVNKTKERLNEFGIEAEVRIASAHRTPYKTESLVKQAEEQGHELIIAAAGLAAHLPGVCAAHTTLPVIGIPVENGPLKGVDSLYSIVMMPPGVPVACMGIGSSGADNAAIFATQILSLKYPELKEALKKFKVQMSEKVEKADQSLS